MTDRLLDPCENQAKRNTAVQIRPRRDLAETNMYGGGTANDKQAVDDLTKRHELGSPLDNGREQLCHGCGLKCRLDGIGSTCLNE
jgi:hypothetical protein